MQPQRWITKLRHSHLTGEIYKLTILSLLAGTQKEQETELYRQNIPSSIFRYKQTEQTFQHLQVQTNRTNLQASSGTNKKNKPSSILRYIQTEQLPASSDTDRQNNIHRQTQNNILPASSGTERQNNPLSIFRYRQTEQSFHHL